MTEESSRMQLVITLFSMIPLWIYLVVAVLLSVVAIVSLYDAVLLTLQLVTHPNLGIGIIDVVRSLLLTITVIVLLETVTVYFRTKHVPVRALLVAGLTGMIRQILVLNTSDIDPSQLLALVAVMAVLIAGVILVKDDDVQKS
jgi:phosphate starvation-inducible membrane PsiE